MPAETEGGPELHDLPARRRELAQYRRGWVDGGGFRAYEYPDMSGEYDRGYRDGRAAFKAAMETARVRLDLPPAGVVVPRG